MSLLLALIDHIQNILQSCLFLRDHYVVGTTSNTAVAGYPAGMASHYLADQDAIV